MEYAQLVIPGLEGELPGGDHPDVDWLNLVVNRNRCRLLEALYGAADRNNPATKEHHTYTGLAASLHYAVGRLVVDKMLESPDFTPSWLFGDGETADG